MKKNKMIAAVLILVLLCGVLFSYSFIICNAHHDCVGQDCPICLEIKEAVRYISFAKFILVLSYVVTVVCAIAQAVTPIRHQRGVRTTLISLKVELLD